MPFTVFGEDSTGRVEFSILSDGMPFVFGKMPITAGVSDGVFAPGEWDAAEGIAVADVAIGKYGENTYAFNTYRDGNDEINFTAPQKSQNLEL